MLNKFVSVVAEWRWLTIGILSSILLLIGINGVVILLRSTTAAQTTAVPGRLLYTTTFDTYQEHDWRLSKRPSQAVIDKGEMRLTVDAESPQYFVHLRRDFTDIDARLNIKWLASPATRGYIGLRFRQESDDAGYYELKLDNHGAYRVEVVRGGHMPEVLSDWQIAPFVLTGKDQINQLRIIAKAYIFSFFLNDHPLPLCLKGQEATPQWTGIDTGLCSTDGQRTRTELVDQTLDGGIFSIGIYTDNGIFSIAFDNLLIYGPR